MKHGRQRRYFEQSIAEACVKRTQRRRSSAESAQPNRVAVFIAREIFGDCENFGGESLSLVFSHHGEQAQIAAAVGTSFEVDTGEQISSGIFVKQEFAFRHVAADADVV